MDDDATDVDVDVFVVDCKSGNIAVVGSLMVIAAIAFVVGKNLANDGNAADVCVERKGAGIGHNKNSGNTYLPFDDCKYLSLF